MKRTQYLFSLLVSLISTGAFASCPIDTSGLSSTNHYDELPGGHISAPGARTLDDFVNATANELFFTYEGAMWLYFSLSDIYILGGRGTVSGPQTPTTFRGHACNEIGQCMSTQITAHVEGLTVPVMDFVTSTLTAGLVSGLYFDYQATYYTIRATDSDGERSNRRDFSPASIRAQERDGEPYSMSTDDDGALDTRCRNNQGNVRITGGGGGSFYTPNWNFDPPISPVPLIRPPSWDCYATSTGVACRRR